MQRILLDTSVYVHVLRNDAAQLLPTPLDTVLQIASAVVIQELLLGANTAERHMLAHIIATYRGWDLCFTPTEAQWLECGEILAAVGQQRGYELVGRSRLTNDTLIALCCRDQHATLWTRNRRDFALLAEYISFGWVGL